MTLFSDILCYLQCISLTIWQYVMLGTTVLMIASFIALFFKQRYLFVLFIQGCATFLILFNILVMRCAMFQLIWIYLGIISIGALLITVGKYYITSQMRDIVPNTSYIDEISSALKVPIKILNASRIRAFAYKKTVYLSVGLLEMLDQNEIKGVAAHEAYHVKYSPDMLHASFFALASFTFIRWNDELLADRYAASIVGVESLSGALRKLEIKNWERRIGRL